MPTLSVILPNYNHAASLPRALDALLSQSRPADQIIVVDDASTDDSLTILKGYASKHPQLRLQQHETNQGVVAAVRTALVHATGDYLYGAAADDMVLDGFFEDAMTQAEAHPQAATVFGKVRVTYTDHRRPEVQSIPAVSSTAYISPGMTLDLLHQLEAGFSLCAATLYRRDAFDQVGGFLDPLESWSDTFAARTMMLRHGGVYLGGRGPCVQWNANPASYSHRTLDREKITNVGRAAAELMRSPAYRELYPEAFVRRWETRWQLEMAGGLDDVNDTLLPRRLRDVRRAYADLGQEGRWFDRLLSAALRAAFARSDRRREGKRP